MAPPTITVEQKTAADHREVFTNFSETKYTCMDVLLRFSVLRDGTPGHLVVTHVVDVAMSPEQAKALHRGLGNVIGAYERQFGTIPQEPTPAGPVN
jgi:hypothetical protein